MPPPVIHTVINTDVLHRRVVKKPSHIGENGQLTSAVFKKSSLDGNGGVSVNIEALLEIPIDETYDLNTHSLFKLSAKVPLDLGCNVSHTPVVGNNSHAEIMNDSKANSKKMSLEAVQYIPIAGTT